MPPRNRNRRNRHRRPVQPPPPPPPSPPPAIQAMRIFNFNLRRQRPRRELLEAAPPPEVELNDEVIYNILIRTNVSTITQCRTLSHWFQQQFASATLIVGYRRLNLQVPMQLHTVMQYLAGSRDRHGFVVMINGGGYRVTTHSLATFDLTGILLDNEVAFLFHVWRNLFIYSVHLCNPYELLHLQSDIFEDDFRDCVALVVFNITDSGQRYRIELSDQQIRRGSFGLRRARDENHVINGDIRVLVNDGNTILQYVEPRSNDVDITYYELVLGGAGNWRTWQVERVDHLSRDEKLHPLAMFHNLGFITFRNNAPVLLPVDREATRTYLISRGIDDLRHSIHAGPCRYTFVLGVTPDRGGELMRITSVTLFSMSPRLNSYVSMSEAS